MMPSPRAAEVHAAELRVALGRQETLDELARARAALRAALVRPSTLALVAGASGLLGYWFARRPASAAASDRTPVTRSIAGLVLTFLLQFGIRRMPEILAHVATARDRRPAPLDPEGPSGAPPA